MQTAVNSRHMAARTRGVVVWCSDHEFRWSDVADTGKRPCDERSPVELAKDRHTLARLRILLEP